ncbi:hypothetical protein ACFL3F_01760 [Planctomycetota bacterium]
MEVTIDGKHYDTEKAQLIHAWDNGVFSSTDFGYRSKMLYRNRNGDWFIHHEGGALTDCTQKYDDNRRTGGEFIEPVTEDDVLKFLQNHGGEIPIADWFGDRIEDA